MDPKEIAKIRLELTEMIKNGHGEEALIALREALVITSKKEPKIKPVTDVLIKALDGELPMDREILRKNIVDNALDAFNEKKISRKDAEVMCGIKLKG